MNSLLVAISIPLFFVSIAVELLVSRLMRKQLYVFEDSIADLSCGIGQQALEVFTKVVSIGGYTLAFTHLRLFTLPDAWWVWVLALFGVDLAYYTFHRASHRVNFFWALHVVHHQSEEYNLAVALRQSWFDKLFEWVFYVPLAVAGLRPEVFVTMSTLNTLYQFWIHTRALGRLPGFIEAIFNTPSHHRVHHGSNPAYIDKNYAGIFIVWDRLFGTFEPEKDEPVYGLVKPLASWSPAWANVHRWVEIAKMSWNGRGLERLYAWIAPPEWMPAAMGGPQPIPEVTRETQVKYAAHTEGTRVGVVLEFVVVAGVLGAMLLFAEKASLTILSLVTAAVFLSLVTWGARFEGKRWALAASLLRLPVLGVAVWLWRSQA